MDQIFYKQINTFQVAILVLACAVLIPSFMNAEKHHKHYKYHGKENEKPLTDEWERKAVYASPSPSTKFVHHKPSRRYQSYQAKP